MMESIAYEELLKRDGQVITHVVGNSMRPLLHDRESIVIVETKEKVPPRKGDVVLYKINGTYILHRILKITPKEYRIRGDNTWIIEHIPKEALLATMTGFYRTPASKLVERNDISCKLYRVALPAVRFVRRIAGKAKCIVQQMQNKKTI